MITNDLLRVKKEMKLDHVRSLWENREKKSSMKKKSDTSRFVSKSNKKKMNKKETLPCIRWKKQTENDYR